MKILDYMKKHSGICFVLTASLISNLLLIEIVKEDEKEMNELRMEIEDIRAEITDDM